MQRFAPYDGTVLISNNVAGFSWWVVFDLPIEAESCENTYRVLEMRRSQRAGSDGSFSVPSCLPAFLPACLRTYHPTYLPIEAESCEHEAGVGDEETTESQGCSGAEVRKQEGTTCGECDGKNALRCTGGWHDVGNRVHYSSVKNRKQHRWSPS